MSKLPQMFGGNKLKASTLMFFTPQTKFYNRRARKYLDVKIFIPVIDCVPFQNQFNLENFQGTN